jgi:hypothetical protein
VVETLQYHEFLVRSLLLHLPVLDGHDEVSGSEHGRGMKKVPDTGKARKESEAKKRKKSEF